MKKKILIIDDDRAIRALNGFSLMRAGYEVVMAPDASTAMLRMGKDNFDLMLLDIQLPSAYANHIVAGMKTKGIKIPPIILVSGMQEVEIQKKVEQCGAVDYLMKPYRASELVSKVNDVMQRHSESPASVSTAEDAPVEN